jgi:hypothetical protein
MMYDDKLRDRREKKQKVKDKREEDPEGNNRSYVLGATVEVGGKNPEKWQGRRNRGVRSASLGDGLPPSFPFSMAAHFHPDEMQENAAGNDKSECREDMWNDVRDFS